MTPGLQGRAGIQFETGESEKKKKRKGDLAKCLIKGLGRRSRDIRLNAGESWYDSRGGKPFSKEEEKGGQTVKPAKKEQEHRGAISHQRKLYRNGLNSIGKGGQSK